MVHRIPLVVVSLLLAAAAGAAWSQGPVAERSRASLAPSNIEGWHNEEAEDEENWTWFGMGYESRQTGSNSPGATAAGIVNGVGAAVAAPQGGSGKK